MVHIDGDRSRQITASEALLRQHQVEDIAATAAELCRDHNGCIAGGFHSLHVLKRKAVLSIMLRHASLEVLGVSGSYFNKPVLAFGPICFHKVFLPRS
jgi:hypothetical protein